MDNKLHRVFIPYVQGARKFKPYSNNFFDTIKVDILNSKTPWYESIYLYSDEHVDSYKKSNSLSGIKDVLTDRVIFDFDSKTNIKLAFTDTRTVAERLEYFGIDESAIRIYFSSRKGFHIEVKFNNGYINRKEFETIVEYFTKGITTFDEKVRDEQRIIRCPLSFNPESGKYKVPFTYKEFVIDQNVEELDEMINWCAEPDMDDRLDIMSKYTEIDVGLFKGLSTALTLEEKAPSPVVSDKLDLSRKPKHLSEAKFALQEGFFEEGERNEACLVLAATYRYLGYNKELAYNMIKATLRLRAERLNLPEYDKSVLWKETINVVYSPMWKGGVFAETEGLLRKTIEKYKLNATNVATCDLIDLSNVSEFFKDFAMNIDKNTLKLGIDEIDKKVRITTGMLVTLLAAPGAGKCHGEGTLIRMFDGSLKKVEDIKTGELIMGDDSTPRRVLSTCSGMDDIYEIVQSNGSSYTVNSAHILSLKCGTTFNDKRKSSYTAGMTKDINILEYMKRGTCFKKHYKGYKVPIDYPKKEVSLDPYFLGIWLGDGTSSKTQITNTDFEVIEYCREYAESLGLTAKNYSVDITHDYVFSKGHTNKLMYKLKTYDLLNNKHIPSSFLINDKETRLQLLAGLIDSDGYVDPRKSGIEITFKNDRLANDTVDLIRSLGFKATLTKVTKRYKSFTNGKLYQGEGIYNRIYINGNNINIIPTKILRKKIILNNEATDTSLTSFKVKSLGYGKYYGFELDGNHRYVLADYTVTHNTSISMSILNTVSKNDCKALFFSLDMSMQQTYQRFIQKHTGQHSDTIFDNYKNNNLTEINKYNKIIESEYKNVKFSFKSGLTVDAIREVIVNEQNETGVVPKIIVIDYLECIHGPFSDASANKAIIATQLKDIANSFNTCVFLLVQPRLSAGGPAGELNSYTDIKGSSVIGEQAAVVLTLSRPGFSPKNPEDDKFACITVVKNRMGQLSTTDLGWDGLTGNVRTLDSDELADLERIRQRTKMDGEFGSSIYEASPSKKRFGEKKEAPHEFRHKALPNAEAGDKKNKDVY